MKTLAELVAKHPIDKKPYQAIHYMRSDHNGVPLYRVGKDGVEAGALKALKQAFEKMGAHCFHCGEYMQPQKLSQRCTRDHVRPASRGGDDYLHNLVFSCGLCNRDKNNSDLASFNVERGSAWLNELDEHLKRCVDRLGKAKP
ncbi:HNH endonuclease [Pacificimonas sp. WHA3]|uniref:HNH endonuclease n=1 Tax=Pacificimonas pallii TaxID=2827236 RepID=A0ABS6SC83_9SPHN|nr:HNH endonuclease [Pacificimonas pallii]MBV7255994.1 HNH endonuclease [Pacificimonas pallii]